MKVLVSAYACEPGRGSEPGVGWNLAVQLARFHEVWVVTRRNNRAAIEAELLRRPVSSLRFHYYDLPRWARFWKRGGRGVQAYYYLWQRGIAGRIRALHREVGFQVAHHLTFGRYWSPSPLASLPVPFVWGPVGGGETAPPAFVRALGAAGQGYERLRQTARWTAERDPFVRSTARRSAIAIATNRDTARRIEALGARRIIVLGHSAVSADQLEWLGRVPDAPSDGARFISVGRLIHWKGFHLGLEAFARAAIPGSEYWVVGEGPEQGRLAALSRDLGIHDQVRFWGATSYQRAFELMAQCHALVHPSLHDSSPFVCIEAQAAGRPVLCLDLGGPSEQITDETGFRIPASTPADAIDGLADAMRRLAHDSGLRTRMGSAARREVAARFLWERKGEALKRLYDELLPGGAQ